MLDFFQFALQSVWSFVGVIVLIAAFSWLCEVIIINVANGIIGIILAIRKVR